MFAVKSLPALRQYNTARRAVSSPAADLNKGPHCTVTFSGPTVVVWVVAGEPELRVKVAVAA